MTQSFKSLHQAFRGAEDVALIEVVCTEILVAGSALEHVIADSQNGVGDSNNGSLVSARGGKPTELGCQVAFLGLGCNPSGLAECPPCPAVSFARFSAFPLSGALVVSRTDSDPTGNVRG